MTKSTIFVPVDQDTSHEIVIDGNDTVKFEIPFPKTDAKAYAACDGAQKSVDFLQASEKAITDYFNSLNPDITISVNHAAECIISHPDNIMIWGTQFQSTQPAVLPIGGLDKTCHITVKFPKARHVYLVWSTEYLTWITTDNIPPPPTLTLTPITQP